MRFCLPSWCFQLVFVGVIASATPQHHPYDPHPIPSISSNKQWFEGWYTRVTIDQGWSMGIIYGGFAPNGLPSNSGRTRNYCALLLQPPAGNKLEVLEFNPAQLTVQQCANRAGTQKPCFDAVIRDLAVNLTIKVRPQEHLYEVFMQDRYRLRLIINGDPVPWSPNGDGPEGRWANLPLPLHWYVFSSRSRTTLQILQHPRLLAGNYTGHAHVEKNWGGSFPSKWLWAQGISESFDFAFAGGDLGINDRLPNAYLLRWRGRNTQFEYGPLDNLVSPLRVDGNYCPRLGGSVVTVRGQLPLQAIAFEITVEAEMKSFEMVQCPTKGGFKPYSTESFLATMKIKVMKSGKLIETAEIPGGALEFGGQWLANDCYTRSRFLML